MIRGCLAQYFYSMNGRIQCPRHIDLSFEQAKSFTLLSLSGKLANFISAILVSLHYNIYKNGVKLATLKICFTSENGKNYC